MEATTTPPRRIAMRAKRITLTLFGVACLASLIFTDATLFIAAAAFAIWALALRLLIGDGALGLGIAFVEAFAITVIAIIPGPFRDASLTFMCVAYFADALMLCWQIGRLSAAQSARGTEI